MTSRRVTVTLAARRVHPAHGPGGLERHVHDQAIHLANAGARVAVYAEQPHDPERQRRAERELGAAIELVWVPRAPLPIGRAPGTVVLDRVTNYPVWARRLARRAGNPEGVVHVHGLAGLGLAEARGRGELAAPLVLTAHGMEEFNAPGLKYAAYAPFRAWMRRIAARADRIVVTDEALVEAHVRHLGARDDQMVVIANAVDVDAGVHRADREGARKLLNAAGATAPDAAGAHSGPLFVSVGRVAANKGYDVLARALGSVAQSLPGGWRWVLIGDGPELERVRAAVRAAGIEDHVVFVGAPSDALKHGLLSLATWFVHPTLYEGSSIATLEAMAHGLPVLASNVGGLPDKVREGATGLLVPAGDATALAARLRTLDGVDAAKLGAAGRALVLERFAWGAAAARLVGLYDELLG